MPLLRIRSGRCSRRRCVSPAATAGAPEHAPAGGDADPVAGLGAASDGAVVRGRAAGALHACAAGAEDRAGRLAGALDGLQGGRAGPHPVRHAQHQPDAAAGRRPVRGRGARRAGVGLADGRGRRCGADAGRRAAQRRHAAGQGDRAADRYAAQRRAHQHQRGRRAGARRQAGAGRAGRLLQGRRGLGDADRGPLCGARRAGPGAGRARGGGAGRQPGPHRDSAQRRARGADRGGTGGRRRARAAGVQHLRGRSGCP